VIPRANDLCSKEIVIKKSDLLSTGPTPVPALTALEMTPTDIGYRVEAGVSMKAAETILRRNWS